MKYKVNGWLELKVAFCAALYLKKQKSCTICTQWLTFGELL